MSKNPKWTKIVDEVCEQVKEEACLMGKVDRYCDIKGCNKGSVLFYIPGPDTEIILCLTHWEEYLKDPKAFFDNHDPGEDYNFRPFQWAKQIVVGLLEQGHLSHISEKAIIEFLIARNNLKDTQAKRVWNAMEAIIKVIKSHWGDYEKASVN